MIKAIVSRETNRIFPEVGTTNRMVISDLKTIHGIRNRAKKYADGKRFRIEYFDADRFYGESYRIEYFDSEGVRYLVLYPRRCEVFSTLSPKV